MHLGLALVLGSAWVAAMPADRANDSPLGLKVPNFTLADFRGAKHSLDEVKSAKVVVVAFLGTECPLAKLYGPRLGELAREYRDKGVAFFGINSNQQDSITELAHYARVNQIGFPILKDLGNQLADQLRARRTPEVFVLDEARVVRYWGRIDDQYGVGYARPKPTRRDLATAIDELLAGKPVSRPLVTADGCLIGRVKQPKAEGPVTFSNQIARLFQKRCVVCHREGEIAPFALTSYAEAVGWAEMILEVTQEQRMPPWHANPKHGEFSNDNRLTKDEKQLIADWVKAGAPEGDPKDLPPPVAYATGWQIPKPDLVLEMPQAFEVPAEGVVQYKYFVVDPKFTEDKWVQAAEARPGNRSVVHHIIILVVPPENRRRGGISTIDQWLVATAPGASPLALPDGQAKFIPAGSKLVFQMHYTPNGTAQSDRSRVGLVFADPKKVTKEVTTLGPFNQWFVIPPGADHHRVECTFHCDQDLYVLSFFPHMHLRGKAFRYEAHYPNGTTEILLDVPAYDFGWQNTYVLKQPKLLPEGTKLRCTAHFDNSEENLSNPDPTQPVRWGDQTWEEMMIGYFDAIPAGTDFSLKPRLPRSKRFLKRLGNAEPKLPLSLQSQAKKALLSDAEFERMAAEFVELVPQTDRICLTTVDKGIIKVERVAQVEEGNQLRLNKGAQRPVAGLALPKLVDAKGTVVQRDNGKAEGLDFRLIGRLFRSSVHVPIVYQGKKATLNFWSRERDGWPPQAVKLIEELAQGMAGARVNGGPAE